MTILTEVYHSWQLKKQEHGPNGSCNVAYYFWQNWHQQNEWFFFEFEKKSHVFSKKKQESNLQTAIHKAEFP
jgi:hypothetical protein